MHFLVPIVKGIEPSENWLRQVFFLSEGEYEALALMVRGLKQNDPMYAYVLISACVCVRVHDREVQPPDGAGTDGRAEPTLEK